MTRLRLARDFLSACEGIGTGRLRLRTPEGHVHDFGSEGIEAEMEIRDWAAVSALLARGDIGFGEGHVQGLWDSPSIEALTTLALANEARLRRYTRPDPWNRLKIAALDRWLRTGSPAQARRNVRAHYDLGNEFYLEWLDPGMTYSSALFAPGDDDLHRGQRRKYDRALDRLGKGVNGGERLLEIGCGWGGLAERAADRGHAVTAVTLSPSQKGYADARLDGRARIELCDYRATTGTYDGVVSIEMIEAVGERRWPTYFATLKARLAEGGRAVIQAITVPDERFPRYRRGSDYLRHATFPGTTLPCPSALTTGAAQAGLHAENLFDFGQDYARTCRIWANRMASRRDRLARLGHGEATLRHWRYYLESSAAGFAAGRTGVVQLELRHA